MRTLTAIFALLISVPAFGLETRWPFADYSEVDAKEETLTAQVETDPYEIFLLTQRIESLEKKLDAVDKRVATFKSCDCEACLSEADVRRIVREEIALTVRKPDGTTKTVPIPAPTTACSDGQCVVTPRMAQTYSSSVPGYAGSYNLAPGERIVAINGVPVSSGQATVNSQRVYEASSGPIYMQAAPTSRNVRVFAPFRSYSQCAGGNCR